MAVCSGRKRCRKSQDPPQRMIDTGVSESMGTIKHSGVRFIMALLIALVTSRGGWRMVLRIRLSEWPPEHTYLSILEINEKIG